ncbi:MAG: hypothetical protein UHS55_03630, partial [Prevotella sp.]|nr:hypothetical protein [Prevotella sp.]
MLDEAKQTGAIPAGKGLFIMTDTVAGLVILSELLVDKEEIGSVGATGMRSHFFENTVAELLDSMGCYNELTLRRTLARSK